MNDIDLAGNQSSQKYNLELARKQSNNINNKNNNNYILNGLKNQNNYDIKRSAECDWYRNIRIVN